MLWSLFAAIFFTLLIPKRDGIVFSFVPNALFEFTPHTHTLPSVSNAKLCVFPTAICVIFMLLGNDTWIGLSLLIDVPFPNS